MSQLVFYVGVGVCTEVSLYVDSYIDLEVHDGQEAGFCEVCLGSCV